jgi:alcohol dehydrogenase class IV
MYEFFSPTKIIFGEGSLAEAAPRLAQMGARNVLVVTGKSSTASSSGFRELCASLDAVGIRWSHFAEVSADPETSIVDKGAEFYCSHQCGGVIGFGGGSPIDCAKGIVAGVAEGRSIRDFVGTGLAFTKPVAPLIAIPTTAGTGTEVTNAAVFTIVNESGQRIKQGTSNYYYFPRLAIIDPLLHASMPLSLTAFTGMDALTHAIEAYVSRFHTPISDMYSLESIRLIGRSLRVACGVDPEIDSAIAVEKSKAARRDMALAATLAGVSLTQAGLGMVHGFAHPIGAATGLAHGLANAILLPYVMEALIPDAAERLSEIGEALTGKAEMSPHESVRTIVQLSDEIGIPKNLDEARVSIDAFDTILAGARAYRRRKASPHAFTDTELRELLLKMYHGSMNK